MRLRLPFVSRRSHEAAVDLLAAIQRANLNDALGRADDEQAARRAAEKRSAELLARVNRAVGDGVVAEYRIERVLRAVAYERAQSAAYRRTIRRLTDQLLDATGYQGEPLPAAARQVLGIEDTKEDK